MLDVDDAIFVGRQPIFDRNLKVIAYELLFRSGADKAQSDVGVEDGDIATARLLMNTIVEMDIDALLDNHTAYINFTANMLLHFPSLPKEKVVIELLEDIVVNDEIIEAVRKLKEEGYTLALDDFIYKPELEPLMELVSIIKIDILALTSKELAEHITQLKKYKVKLLAEKVETYEQLEECKKLGCDYFQGFFLSKPNVISGKQTSTNKIVVLDLISKLQQPNISAEEVEAVLSRDAKLSYKILKIINSAAYGTVNEINSIKHAIVFMGIQKLKEWVSLILVNSVDNKPTELMSMTMVRAKMCELVAEHCDKKHSNAYFMVGLFSTLDALMDESLDVLLEKLSLVSSIKESLLQHKGKMGEILENVLAYEQSDWGTLLKQNIDIELYSNAYMESVQWASEMCHSVRI